MHKYKLGLAVYTGVGRWEDAHPLTHRYIACGIQNSKGFTGFVTDYAGGGSYQDEWFINGKPVPGDPGEMSCEDPELHVDEVYPGLAKQINTEVSKIAKWDDAAEAYVADPKFVKLYRASVVGDDVYTKGVRIELQEIGLSYFS
jgi:hypothetical protein